MTCLFSGSSREDKLGVATQSDIPCRTDSGDVDWSSLSATVSPITNRGIRERRSAIERDLRRLSCPTIANNSGYSGPSEDPVISPLFWGSHGVPRCVSKGQYLFREERYSAIRRNKSYRLSDCSKDRVRATQVCFPLIAYTVSVPDDVCHNETRMISQRTSFIPITLPHGNSWP